MHEQVSKKDNNLVVAEVEQGMVFHSHDGTIQACNRAAELILELTAEQLTGCIALNPFWQAIHEDGSPFKSDAYPATISLRTGKPCKNISMGLCKPSGEIIWLSIDSQPLFQTGDKTAYGAVTTFTKIAASKEDAESEVPVSSSLDTQRLFDRIAKAIPGLLYLYDLVEQRNIYVNHQVVEILGYTEEQIQTTELQSLFQLMHPDDLARFSAHFERLNISAQGEVINFEYRYRHANGEWRWFCSYDTVFSRTADGVPQQILGIAQDITERRLIEEALRQSEEQYRYLTNAIPEILFSTNSQGQADYINQRWEEYTGLNLKQTAGYGWLQAVHPNDVSTILQPLQAALQNGKLYENEHRFRRASDNMYRWHLVRGFPVKDTQGQVVKWVGTCIDIQDTKQIQEQQQELLIREQAARTEAETANRIKDQFLAVLSHEMRSPLNPILGWTKLLRTRQFDRVAVDRALEIIERNAKMQLQLIDDLLDVSRILRGKLSLTFTTVNLISVIDSAIETVRLAAEGKSIHLQFSVVPELPGNSGQGTKGWRHSSIQSPKFPNPQFLVLGDFHRLQQVVGNLLNNAVKFTPAGGQVQVRLSVEGNRESGVESRDSHSALIEVIDTGVGISPDFLPHIFEYFRQADSSTTRKSGGLGLGLAIVRNLVQLHGGTVQAYSLGEGQGATFTVRLPLIQEKKVDEEMEKGEEISSHSLNLQGLQILIVDDDVDNREFLSFLLEQHGATTTVTASATEAYATLEKSKPDLLLSDLGMPEVDGYSLIRQVRSLPSNLGRIPAIALTAYAAEADQERVFAAGFQKHIAKPVDPDLLLMSIVELLGRKRI